MQRCSRRANASSRCWNYLLSTAAPALAAVDDSGTTTGVPDCRCRRRACLPAITTFCRGWVPALGCPRFQVPNAYPSLLRNSVCWSTTVASAFAVQREHFLLLSSAYCMVPPVLLFRYGLSWALPTLAFLLHILPFWRRHLVACLPGAVPAGAFCSLLGPALLLGTLPAGTF